MTAILFDPAAWPRIHPARLLVAPRLDVASADDECAGQVTVTIRGLVCGVCAARTRAALLATPGVAAASVDLEGGTATLRLRPGTIIDAAALQRSLDRVVLGRPARRGIERVAVAARAAWTKVAGGRPR